MTTGIILSLIWIVLMGVSSTAQKFVAVKYENFLALVVQYLGMAIFAGIGVLIATQVQDISFRPERNATSLAVLAGTGIFGFIGILFLWKGFEKMNGWIVLVIANLAAFLMYFVNIYLFDANEKLGILQVIFAILFFIVISQFLIWKSFIRKTIKKLFEKKTDKKQKISKKSWFNKAALYPMVTAFCWAIFGIWNTYFVKTGTLHPMQSVFFTEWTIFLISIFAFLRVYKAKISALKKIKLKHLPIFGLSTIMLVGGNFMLYYAYLDTPANIVNVIRLFSIITTAVFARIVLKDKMNKRNIILMGIAFAVLLLFVFAKEITQLIQ